MNGSVHEISYTLYKCTLWNLKEVYFTKNTVEYEISFKHDVQYNMDIRMGEWPSIPIHTDMCECTGDELHYFGRIKSLNLEA